MIVVDVNALVYLWVPGEHADSARKLLERDADWRAPLLWRSEFRNVLVLFMRRGLITLEKATQVMAAADAQMRDSECEVDSMSVLKLAATTSCSAYDCEYVALAQRLGAPLVTSDRQVLAAFPAVAVHLDKFAPRT